MRELQYESEGGAGGEAGAGDGEEVGEEATFFPQQQPGESALYVALDVCCYMPGHMHHLGSFHRPMHLM